MKTKPAVTDRLIDATALLFLIGGVGLFTFARSTLGSIANGTYETPTGISAVTVTEFYDAQSTMALWLTGVGIAVGIFAAVRYFLRKR